MASTGYPSGLSSVFTSQLLGTHGQGNDELEAAGLTLPSFRFSSAFAENRCEEKRLEERISRLERSACMK